MNRKNGKSVLSQKSVRIFMGSALAGIVACCVALFGTAGSGKSLPLAMTVALWVLLAVVFVLAVAGCVNFKKTVSNPLHDISEICGKFAEGELKVSIDYRGNGDVGYLADSLNSVFQQLQVVVNEISGILQKMSGGDFVSYTIRDYKNDFAPISQSFRKIDEQLNSTFALFQSSAEQVDAGAKQVSDGAQELAQGNTEQASSSEELSASIQEIAPKTGETSEHVAKATEYLSMTSQNVEDSNEQMKKMLAAMEEISASSGEISKIIKVIDNIAFQTNILALNAAVEAARAGDAGKGFAVVADEVRSLAGKSAEAAKQTAELIENTLQKIKDGMTFATGTAKTLDAVTEKIEKLNDTTQKINKASATQSAAIEQITQGVEQISTVIQTNSATAEESAAASEELLSQARVLTDELLKYKVKESAVSVKSKSEGMVKEVKTEKVKKAG